MILRNVQLGKHEVEIMAQIGTGDVTITSHYDKTDVDVLITFHNQEGGTVGNKMDCTGKTSDDLPEIPLGLRFTNPKSIDVLIRQLQDTKSNLEEMLLK